jgi:hypothetical protein
MDQECTSGAGGESLGHSEAHWQAGVKGHVGFASSPSGFCFPLSALLENAGEHATVTPCENLLLYILVS